MTNKIDTVLKAITDRIAGALPSDMVKNPKLSTSLVLSARSYPTIDPQCSSHPSISINAIKAHSKEANISQTSMSQTGMGIETQQPEEPEPTLKDKFQDLHLNLPVFEVLVHAPIYNSILDKYIESLELEETDHIFGLADGTKSYPIGIVIDVEVHIGKLKLLNDFYVIDMKKDPETPLLVGKGFIATANAVIDCRMAKIAENGRILMSHTHNLKSNMWESEDLIKNPINWNKPPKNGDGAWHAKIRLIDPDGEEFTKTLQPIPTTRKLFERESPREIIDLDHFYDT
ncbi:MAK10-like protein [Tanacetum coccineum]